MKFFWREIPFFRIFLFFLAGLIAPIQPSNGLLLTLLLIQALGLWLLRKHNACASGLLFTFLFSIGSYLGRSPENPSFIQEGMIKASVTELFASGKCIARVDYYSDTDASWKPSSVLVFVKDSLGLIPGESFLANGTFTSTDSIMNSGWSDFLKKKRITATASFRRYSSIETNQWSDHYRTFAFRIKQRIHLYLRQTMKDENAAGLMLSLLMGGTGHLDDQLKSDFRNAGVMHIIAVSGMHLSLLFVCIAEIIFLVKRNRRIDVYTLLLCGLFIWTYAALTGFSSSVLRAAVMFSVMMFSNYLNRGYHSWNAYFLSATILLFVFPDMLSDLGFHLSYLAVAGIFLSQPILNQLRFEPNYWVRNIKSAAVMSIAAQLMVSPYLIYLFGTFSPLFLIANLIMVPLSSMLVYMGIIHLILFPFSMLNTWSGGISEFFLHALIYCARILNATVYVNMNLAECLLWYGMIALMLLFVYYKKKYFFFGAFLISAVLCGIHLL